MSPTPPYHPFFFSITFTISFDSLASLEAMGLMVLADPSADPSFVVTLVEAGDLSVTSSAETGSLELAYSSFVAFLVAFLVASLLWGIELSSVHFRNLSLGGIEIGSKGVVDIAFILLSDECCEIVPW